MSRRMAREFAMQLVYQMEVQRDGREGQLEEAFESNELALTPRDIDYVRDVALGVFEHIPEIDGLIGKNAHGWRISRLSRVDLAILRLCVYEIRFRDDIPLSVSINEAVELAKKYGAESTGSFVNGILSKAGPAVEFANASNASNAADASKAANAANVSHTANASHAVNAANVSHAVNAASVANASNASHAADATNVSHAANATNVSHAANAVKGDNGENGGIGGERGI